MTGEKPAFVPPMTQTVTCFVCGGTIPAEDASGMDISADDEYYPDMRAVCPGCA